jgi:prepilin-type N-terminal cleavage/methylation domain-containing protein
MNPKRPAKTPSAARWPGFTLIELILVVIIVAVLSTIAIPRYMNSQMKYRADAAARRVAADLQVAQTRARIRSTPQTVTFSLANSSYTLDGMPNPDHPASTYTVGLPEAPYGATLVTVNFNGTATIGFDQYGMPIPATGGTAAVRVGDQQRTISVEANTGRVSVQ